MKQKRAPLCRWGCGKPTKNISRICDSCWARRDEIRGERMEAKKGKSTQRWGRDTRGQFSATELPTTGLSAAEDG